jgi:hypothetical protein
MISTEEGNLSVWIYYTERLQQACSNFVIMYVFLKSPKTNKNEMADLLHALD